MSTVEPSPSPLPVDLQHDWRRFTLLTFLFSFGFAVYNGVFQNFFRLMVGPEPLPLGWLEAFREVPGLLTALTAGTLVALAETRIAVVGLVITAVGIGLTGLADQYLPLVAISVFWSIGFHLWSTMQPAITLTLAKGVEGGRHLGRMRSVGALATILALGFSGLVARFAPKLAYEVYFALAGAAILAAAWFGSQLSAHASGGARQPIVFRREYGLFYLLTFLEGCRRQVFGIFALFTLIAVYNTPLPVVLALSFINAILAALTSPWIGRLIDRVGEREPLTWYAVGLIGIFLGYAFFRDVRYLYALFILDNLLFSFSIGLNTYLHQIVRPGELTPSLAMGTTMNHIAAVTLPVIGAWAWKVTGNYQVPFVIGAGIALVALIATRFLPSGPVTHSR